MTVTTMTIEDTALAQVIGDALTGDPDAAIRATQLLAVALATDGYCDRATRQESYPHVSAVMYFARRLVDRAVPGNMARLNILLAAAQRHANNGMVLPKEARLIPLKDGVYRVACGWGGESLCTGTLGTLSRFPDGWEMKQHADGRHLRRERFTVRPGRSDQSVCPVCRRPNTITAPTEDA